MQTMRRNKCKKSTEETSAELRQRYVDIQTWTGDGTPDRSASSPARRISGAPPSKIAFLENITGPSHRPRKLLLDLVQPQPPPFVSALLYHIQADPPDIVYSDLVEGSLDE